MKAEVIGAIGAVIGLFSSPLTWWIKGMVDRRKAEDSIIDSQWKRFQDECARLAARIGELEHKVEVLETELTTTREERDEYKSKVIRMEAYALGRGEARQASQIEASALEVPLKSSKGN